MSKTWKIGTCPYCHGRHPNGPDLYCEAEFEGWEIDYELREKEDYEGLIAHYEAVVAWRPDGLSGLYSLGEAYVMNGEPQKAIELLTEPHRRHPYDEDYHHVILDALFALGKGEDDFDWVERIPVYRLDASTLDQLLAFLKPKRKPRDSWHLYDGFWDGYKAFTEEELLAALRRDERFVVQNDEYGGALVRARRKREMRKPHAGSQGASR